MVEAASSTQSCVLSWQGQSPPPTWRLASLATPASFSKSSSSALIIQTFLPVRAFFFAFLCVCVCASLFWQADSVDVNPITRLVLVLCLFGEGQTGDPLAPPLNTDDCGLSRSRTPDVIAWLWNHGWWFKPIIRKHNVFIDSGTVTVQRGVAVAAGETGGTRLKPRWHVWTHRICTSSPRRGRYCQPPLPHYVRLIFCAA